MVEAAGGNESAFKEGDIHCQHHLWGLRQVCSGSPSHCSRVSPKLHFKQGTANSISCFTASQALLHSARVKAGGSVLGLVEEVGEQ